MINSLYFKNKPDKFKFLLRTFYYNTMDYDVQNCIVHYNKLSYIKDEYTNYLTRE